MKIEEVIHQLNTLLEMRDLYQEMSDKLHKAIHAHPESGKHIGRHLADVAVEIIEEHGKMKEKSNED